MSRSPALDPTAISPEILDQAAAWLALVQQRALDAQESAELEAWRGRSKTHEQAWQAAVELRCFFRQMPTAVGTEVLGRQREHRRTVLKSLLGLAIAAPVGYAAWLHTPGRQADFRTSIGQREDVTLPDGSRLTLNTDSAVRLAYSEHERRLVLVEGEILVATSKGPSADPRAFVVQSGHGTIRALGTRFEVRALGDGLTHVSVFDDAVVVRPNAGSDEHRIEAGRTLAFNRQQVFPAPDHERSEPAWSRGQLISDNQRLEEFLAELARYRPGIVRCDPAVSDLRLSGVFQLDNTDRVLDLLSETLPVRIERRTRFWVTVVGR